MEVKRMLLCLVSVFLLAVQIASTQKEGESCVLPHTNNPAVCAQASKCQSAKQDSQNKEIRPVFCNQSIEPFLLCCEEETNKLKSENNTNSNSVLDGNETLRISERKCAEYSRTVLQTADCSLRSEVLLNREIASQGEFPHMAVVGLINNNNTLFECEGSLISPQFVLTAAHCVLNPRVKNSTSIFVRLGDHNIDPDVEDGASPFDITVKAVHIHPDYKSYQIYGDIALLELEKDVIFRADIKPACLWTKPDFSSYAKAIVAFWELYNTRPIIKQLQKVSLTLIENDYCDEFLADIRFRSWGWFGLMPSQLCATVSHRLRNDCSIPSTSPLQVASHDNQCTYYIMGITSFELPCTPPETPKVYTRVSNYIEWIESVVWPGE